jgi:hypothetical protein
VTPGPTSRPTPPQTSLPAICRGTIVAARPGSVASPDLIEISGLAASRSQPGTFWAHNDSGDTARVFAMDTAGQSLGTYTLTGAEAIDWEDMAIGPGPQDGASYLYLGDIGDNASIRAEIVVYRVAEPTVDQASSPLALVGVESLVLRYPDGAHDAETLLVDPVSGDLFIITKDISGGPSRVFRAPASALVAGPVVLEQVAQIDFASLVPQKVVPPDSPPLPTALGKIPTGGDVSPAGDLIAIRTYGTVWVWSRPPGTALADAFASAPCEGPSVIEAQGEAIAFAADGASYFTASEGLNVALHQFLPD